jgi:PPOX class probable FMN-dependent enzyme
MTTPDSDTITNLAALEALFGEAAEVSIRKEVPYLHPVYRQWIEASPFAVLATRGPDGLDTSPRGDPAPLVTVLDEHTLLLPERRGNNRIDSLRNILADPHVALLFFVPGTHETLRVNGLARISVAPELLARLAINGVQPKCVIEIRVQTVYFQCARALLRSKLWDPRDPGLAATVPSAGAMLAAVTQNAIDGAAYDAERTARQRATMY